MNKATRIVLSSNQRQDRRRFGRNRFLSCVTWLLIVVFSFAAFPAAALAAEPWQATHDKGIELARAGDFKQAISIFADLRSRYPNAAPVWIDSAMVLHWSGDDKGATNFYEASLRNRRDLPLYLKEAMANAYSRQERFAESLTLMQELAATGERRYRIRTAELLIRLQNPAEAQKIYEAYLAENPEDLEVLISRGQARLINGDNRKAAEDLELAAKIAEKKGDADKKRQADSLWSAASLRSNDIAQAIAILKPYSEKKQADSVMQADYIYALRLNGKFAEAIAAAASFWPDLNKAPVYGVRVLGDVFLKNGNLQEAIRAYAIVLAAEPKNHLAMLGTAVAKGQLGQVAEALQLYDRVLTQDKRLAEVVLDDCLFFVAQGKLWTGQRVFALLNQKVPPNAAFYRHYSDKLLLSGLPREAYKNYQILRGLPGGDTAGTAGMSKAATAVGDYGKARSLLNTLDRQQLKNPIAAQALREYEEREKGAVGGSFVYYRDYKGKENTIADASFWQHIGGNVRLLGQTRRIHLRNTDNGDVADYTTLSTGLWVRGMKYDLRAWWDFANLAGLDGHRLDFSFYPNDISSFTVYTNYRPVDEADAIRQRVMARNYGAYYTWRTMVPSPDGNRPRERDSFTVAYGEGNFSDGNKNNSQSVEWSRTLRDDPERRLVWSNYFRRSRYAATSNLYDSPGLRQTFGTGIANRLKMKQGYWEWKAFIEYGGDHPFAWDFSPYLRLEYGHFFTSLFYLTAGCEYGLTSKNARGSTSLDFSKFQCDLNVNLSW